MQKKPSPVVELIRIIAKHRGDADSGDDDALRWVAGAVGKRSTDTECTCWVAIQWKQSQRTNISPSLLLLPFPSRQGKGIVRVRHRPQGSRSKPRDIGWIPQATFFCVAVPPPGSRRWAVQHMPPMPLGGGAVASGASGPLQGLSRSQAAPTSAPDAMTAWNGEEGTPTGTNAGSDRRGNDAAIQRRARPSSLGDPRGATRKQAGDKSHRMRNNGHGARGTRGRGQGGGNYQDVRRVKWSPVPAGRNIKRQLQLRRPLLIHIPCRRARSREGCAAAP